jgi:predicted MFS family arabinose efflux permease
MTSAAASHRPISVALGGFIALAVAMGIGRFVYTPILPFMAEGLGLTKGEAGLIASANFLGYLLGALGASSAALPGGRRAWAIAALAVSALSTGVMGLSSSLPVFLVLRFIGGVASAFALVFASALVLDRLTAAGRPALIALYFAGVGSGIVLSALLVAGLAAAGYDWRVFWLASGALSLLGLGAVVRLVPGMAEVKPAAAAQRGGPIDRRLLALIAAYGLFGFGYVITATFISTIVRSSPDLKSIEPVVWLIVGLAAIPSVAIWAWVGRRIGNGRGFAIACVAEAVGVTLSVLATQPPAVALAAALLGGTFVGITATGLVNARELSTADPRRSLALMTAIFGVGQMIGPTFAGFVHDLSGNFRLPSLAAAAALVIAAALVGATASGPAAARRRC